jgi:hypothetical protein
MSSDEIGSREGSGVHNYMPNTPQYLHILCEVAWVLLCRKLKNLG